MKCTAALDLRITSRGPTVQVLQPKQQRERKRGSTTWSIISQIICDRPDGAKYLGLFPISQGSVFASDRKKARVTVTGYQALVCAENEAPFNALAQAFGGHGDSDLGSFADLRRRDVVCVNHLTPMGATYV
jgi:hypothetical protein